MAVLVITHKDSNFRLPLPYQVFINGKFAGVMTKPQAWLQLPAGKYVVTICFGGTFRIGKRGKMLDLTLSSTEVVNIADVGYTCLEFQNKERWWDILFSIDLIVWLILMFFTLPHPWNLIYHIISDGFFLVWLIRLYVVRKRYFSIETTQSIYPPKQVK